jgi:HSP20 family molecular chaperone IbpA
MNKTFFLALLITTTATPLYAATQQQSTYDKEQLKQDYRVFLQQLKSLNAQYKEITGEMGKVMKEEGVPTWDMGDGLNIGDKAKENTQDLGGGAFLKETEKEMSLTLDLPGYKKDSIKLTFKDSKTLVINAQRKLDSLTRSFERSFDLPSAGDQKNSAATYEDGVLTVKIPKTTSPQEVAIPIR